MKSTAYNYFLIVLLAASLITSCKKDNSPQQTIAATGNGNISYFAKASGTGISTKTSAKSGNISATAAIAWSSASIYVDKISFVGKSGSLLDTTIVVGKNLNIFTSDALAGIIKLPAASYKDVKVKLYLLKSPKSELAFNLRGTFINTQGGKDSLIVASSYPFEANLVVNDMALNPSDNYKATFNFNLDQILTGISTSLLQTAPSYLGANGLRTYSIWKGGSETLPLFIQVATNWQTVATVSMVKQ